MARQITPTIDGYHCCSALPYRSACLSQAEFLWRSYPEIVFYSPNRLFGYIGDVARTMNIVEVDLDDGESLFTRENYRTTMRERFDEEVATEFVVRTGLHRAEATLDELLRDLVPGSVIDVSGISDDLRGARIMKLSDLDIGYRYYPSVPFVSRDLGSYLKAFKSVEDNWTPVDREKTKRVVRDMFVENSWDSQVFKIYNSTPMNPLNWPRPLNVYLGATHPKAIPDKRPFVTTLGDRQDLIYQIETVLKDPINMFDDPATEIFRRVSYGDSAHSIVTGFLYAGVYNFHKPNNLEALERMVSVQRRAIFAKYLKSMSKIRILTQLYTHFIDRGAVGFDVYSRLEADNGFIDQTIATIIGDHVERPENTGGYGANPDMKP